MVFTEIDKEVATIISTLVKYVGNTNQYKESIVTIGQYLGVPKEETLGIMEEWEEADSLVLKNTAQKNQFIKEAFAEVLFYEDDSIKQLYIHVRKELGINA
ncbi:MAG: hypothetical protein RIA69_05040 [Cyclobacteriaceae bacterium]